MTKPSLAFMRWKEVYNRAYDRKDHRDVLDEFQKRMKAIGDVGCSPTAAQLDERYDLCTYVMLSILEPAVNLSAEADEYEECMRAQDIMEELR